MRLRLTLEYSTILSYNIIYMFKICYLIDHINKNNRKKNCIWWIFEAVINHINYNHCYNL